MTDTALRNMVREAITNAYYDARNKSETMEVAADNATAAVMKIAESVHENALGYGQLLGEERVLDALIEGRLPKASQRHWWDRTKQKIEAAKA